MSYESLEIFQAAWDEFMVNPAGADPGPLTAAAQGHTGASRPISLVLQEFAAANADPIVDAETTQELAQELDGIRRAEAVLAGALPGRMPAVGTGG